MKTKAIKELCSIPGVGPKMATYLWQIGIKFIDDLKSQSPIELYEKHNQLFGSVQDRCVLYVYRCAVYYAETPENERDPEKLKWWNWKDK